MSGVPGLILFTNNVKVVVVFGAALFVTMAATSGPAPAPNPPGNAALFVTSTVVAVIVVRRSVTVSFTAGLLTDVAVTVTLYGPPATAPGGRTAFTMTV